MGSGEGVFTETEKETGFTDTRVTNDEDFGEEIISIICFRHCCWKIKTFVLFCKKL